MLRKKGRGIPARGCGHYSSLMGLKAAYVKITSAKTRLEAAGQKRHLLFMAAYAVSKEAIDYVVVHELAHTVHKTTASFYKCIEIMPDYKSAGPS